MSIDYLLHKKLKKNRIIKTELEFIDDPELVINNIEVDENGDVTFFTANLSESPFTEGYEFTLQPEGDYWTYTYNYEPEDFAEFIKVISKVSTSLGLLIDNPQTDQNNLTAEQLDLENMEKIVETQRKVIKNMPDILKQAGIELQDSSSDLDLYENKREELVQLYADQNFYVDNILSGNKGGSEDHFASWVVTVPTVLPPVDKIIVMENASNESAVYLISKEQLSKVLGHKFITVLEPVLHHIVPAITDKSLLELIFSNGTQLK